MEVLKTFNKKNFLYDCYNIKQTKNYSYERRDFLR